MRDAATYRPRPRIARACSVDSSVLREANLSLTASILGVFMKIRNTSILFSKRFWVVSASLLANLLTTFGHYRPCCNTTIQTVLDHLPGCMFDLLDRGTPRERSVLPACTLLVSAPHGYKCTNSVLYVGVRPRGDHTRHARPQCAQHCAHTHQAPASLHEIALYESGTSAAPAAQQLPQSPCNVVCEAHGTRVARCGRASCEPHHAWTFARP